MTDKELAEKVAESLGWVKDGNVWNKWESSTHSSTKWLEPLEGKGGIETVVFSWPTFGLIIEKAEEMGWELIITEGKLYFSKDSEKGWEVTCPFDIKEHGYCKVIALAFLEVE